LVARKPRYGPANCRETVVKEAKGGTVSPLEFANRGFLETIRASSTTKRLHRPEQVTRKVRAAQIEVVGR